MTSLKPDQTADWIILTIGVKFDGANPSFFKPKEAAFADRYTIDQEPGAKEAYIYIDKGDFPVYLQLESDVSFLGFGFAKADRSNVRPRKHTTSGPCGGCFTLLIDEADPGIILIQNDGVDYEEGYDWWLWTDPNLDRLPIDPRIYNHGKIPPWPRKPGIFARLWRFLARLWKG